MSYELKDILKMLDKALNESESVVLRVSNEGDDLKVDATKLMFGDGDYDDIVVETYENGEKSPKDDMRSPKNNAKLGDKLVDDDPVCPCDKD